jgi:hypothetical protein
MGLGKQCGHAFEALHLGVCMIAGAGFVTLYNEVNNPQPTANNQPQVTISKAENNLNMEWPNLSQINFPSR